METMKVVLYYPGGFHIKTKILHLTELELMSVLRSNKVFSENSCFLIEDKVFCDVGAKKAEVRIVLGDCY